jgi:uncharacterized membrane protein
LNWYALGANFLGTGVEFVEALTIILAVGAARSWKSSLLGAFTAILTLAALVAIIGLPLVNIVQIGYVQTLVGLLMLLFGTRWLRKAVLRYAGLKALHDEAAAYREELERQRKAGAVSSGIDRVAFSTSFSGTFLEGLEAIFIVITLGISTHSMKSSIIGAVLAIAVVFGLGLVLKSPLSRVPENTLKFVVGIMLTSFGAYWIGEGFGVHWPQQDVSILYIVLSLCLASGLLVYRVKAGFTRRRRAVVSASVEGK